MYKPFINRLKSCVQAADYSTNSFSNNVAVGKGSNLCNYKAQFLPRLLPLNLNLLTPKSESYDHNPHSLLQLLLIYLKKGY